MSPTHRRTLVALIAGAAFLAACGIEPPAKSKAFKTKPQAPTPELVVQWSSRLTDPEFFTSHPAEFASPAHVGSTDELLVGTSKGRVYKFQAANGNVLWQVNLDTSVSAQPAVGRGFAFIGALNGQMYALELHNGSTAWTFAADNSIETPPTHAEGRILFSDVSDTLYALDATNGNELWRYKRAAPDFFTVQGTCEPTVVDGEVYCGFADGHAVALQLETGDVLWEVDLSAGNKEFTDVDGRVLADKDTLYAASYSGGLFAIDRVSGEILWRYELGNISGYVLSDGLIYATSAVGRVVAIDPEEGRPLWSFRLEEALPVGLMSYGPYLVVTTNQGLYVLDKSSGYPFSRTRSTSSISATGEFGADRGYVLNDYGQIMAFKLGW